MIRSMTGFGAADGMVGMTHVSVEVRAVNHRFFSPSLKLPAALSRWEGEVREALRKRIARGHVTLTARLERDQAPAAVIDEARFAEYASQLKTLRDANDLRGEVEVATVLRLPDVVRAGATDDLPDDAAESVVGIVDRAATALAEMREREGAVLAAVILERLGIVESAVERIAARAPERVIAQRDRLLENVAKLANGLVLDEQRMAQEIAILADRLDVGEEIDRFRTHIAAFSQTLRAGAGDGVGKRLGFLLQEMLREANTTGSKANDAEIQRDVIAIKEELERIREQVENIE
ncbi:MAG: YicC family protein [Gemmatimonadetes bacterium]|nr:YicC family protein [Gemmatimonadota bacterium]